MGETAPDGALPRSGTAPGADDRLHGFRFLRKPCPVASALTLPCVLRQADGSSSAA